MDEFVLTFPGGVVSSRSRQGRQRCMAMPSRCRIGLGMIMSSSSPVRVAV